MDHFDDIVRNHRALERGAARIGAVQLSSAAGSLRGLNLGQISQLIAQAEDVVRIYLGPLDDILRQLAGSPLLSQINIVMKDIEDRFRSPELNEAMKLMRELDARYFETLKTLYGAGQSALQLSLQAMNTKWLDSLDTSSSIQGFMSLQAIGYGLRNVPPFDDDFTDALRLDLGDWRGELDLPDSTLLDLQERTSFYEAQGLNPRLTVFPANAFEQAITVAGILDTPPPIIAEYDPSPILGTDKDEEGLRRTVRAYDRLHRFETQIRNFIDGQMTQAIGTNWVTERVPHLIHQEWFEKQQKAADGRNWPLIAYADFSDYETIIVRRDNWRDIFSVVFQNKASIEESFRRLRPIRVCTMHARVITQDDELYLLAETKRILKAIGISV